MSESFQKHQKNSTKRSEWIPEEMHPDILKHLPEKSLIQFKSVSKSWDSTISHNPPKLILWSSKSIYVMDYQVCTAKVKKLDLPMESAHTLKLTVWASCNGILWIRLNRFEDFLWNPLTGEHKKLPFNRIPGRLYGFGYDYSRDDYKIILFLDVGKPPHIFSVKTDSWKVLNNTQEFLKVHSICYADGTLVNNSVLYWHAYASGAVHTQGDSCIISLNSDYTREGIVYPVLFRFDLVNETSLVLVYPEGINKHRTQLMDFKGSLCAFEVIDKVQIEMWVLKEDKAKRSWMKLMSIDCIDIFPSLLLRTVSFAPVYFTRDGEVLLNVAETKNSCNRRKIIFYGYNSREETFREVSVHGISYWVHEIHYIETLASLNQKGIKEGEKGVEKQK